MRRTAWILALTAAVVGAAAAAGVYWWLCLDEPQWTTRSPAALEEFLAGFENRSKQYFYDAAVSFERALELDPDFAAARLYLGTLFQGRAERQQCFDELRRVDLDALTPRERFLVRHGLALHDGEIERAGELVRSYLAEHPEDPFGIRAECDLLWEAQSWDEAEACYRRLLKLQPNWVEAQDRLGYIALARGRFADAEEQFLVYRYLAPDQAGPYRSLASLMLLLGRYEETEEAISEALRIKPDFCEAYPLEVRLRVLTGEPERALEALDEFAAIPTCAYFHERGYFCAMRVWITYHRGDPEAAWELASGECREQLEKTEPVIVHRIAAMTGRWAEADWMEEALGMRLAEARELKKPLWAKYYIAITAHARGVRLMASGHLERAAERFREADERLDYWVPELASFKLFNRLHLLRMLELLERDEEAAALLAEIDAVNPRAVEGFRIPDLETLRKPAERSVARSPWERGESSD
jgi:tetratricopeptide (TPR) repeat protein